MNNAVDLDKFKFNPNLRNEYREKLGVNNKFVLDNMVTIRSLYREYIYKNIYINLDTQNTSTPLTNLSYGL